MKQTLSESKPSKNLTEMKEKLITKSYLLKRCLLKGTPRIQVRKLFPKSQSMPSLVFGAEIIQATTSATDSSELTTLLPKKDFWGKNKEPFLKTKISS